MNYLGIDYEVQNLPVLDRDFIPFSKWMEGFLQSATEPIAIAVERNDGLTAVKKTYIHGDEGLFEADYRFVERFVKFLLWSRGGFRVTVCGDSRSAKRIADRLKTAYSAGGERDFDRNFMTEVFERPFEVVYANLKSCPEEYENAESVGRHLDGCRIGFDAGGSDRKVSAVVDGETIYSEEVVWFPKQQEDPKYHYEGIVDAFRTAASKMPRVDAIGVSTAGVIVKNHPMVSSLFIKVPKEHKSEVKDIYLRAAKEIGDVPILVANDGDVSALAGAMSLDVGDIMGIAMGTSEAAGYVDAEGNIAGWLNELAFAPVDLSEGAMEDEWSHDIGVGCKYFSQDAVIKLAPNAGITLCAQLSLAEKLKSVQNRLEHGDAASEKIFESIGCYLAHALALYAQFYELRYVLMLGRVMSGKGGDLIFATCNNVLKNEYPELAERLQILLPDEKIRRVGQSVAAASLPAIK